MRKLPAFFLCSAVAACVASGVQACSSDPGAADLGQPDASVRDATTDATVDSAAQTSSSSSSSGAPRSTKPTDGGIDLDDLEPGEHALQVNGCPAFVACGGDVAGKDYTYSGGCFDEDGLEAALRATAQCDGIEVSNSRAVVSGSFDFNPGSQYVRSVRLRFSGDVLIPGTCTFLALVGGCDGLSASAASIGFNGLQCYDPQSGTGCDCVLKTDQQQATMGAYTTSDGGAENSLVLLGGDGGAVRAPYCITGGELEHQERDARQSAADPGTYITWKLEAAAL